MTTIVWRDGVLAADSLACGGTSGWVHFTNARKVWRLRDGRLAAACGDYALCCQFREWLKGRAEKPSMKDSNGIEISADGKWIKVYQDTGWFLVNPRDFHAWGSGFPPARAALLMGASARKAVWIASKCDPATGGRIYSVTLRLGWRERDIL